MGLPIGTAPSNTWPGLMQWQQAKVVLSGRTVAVDQSAIGQAAEDLLNVLGRKHIAACQKLTERAQVLELMIDHHVEQAAGEPKRRTP